MKYYIERDKVPVEVDMMEWAKWFESTDRRVRWHKLSDGTELSTVFVGMPVGAIYEGIAFGGQPEFRDRTISRTDNREIAINEHMIYLAYYCTKYDVSVVEEYNPDTITEPVSIVDNLDYLEIK